MGGEMTFMNYLLHRIGELRSLPNPTEDELLELRLKKKTLFKFLRNPDDPMAKALKVWE